MSRFVSSGAIDPTSGDHVESAEAKVALGGDSAKAERNKEAWEAVQKEVEEERKRRAAEKGSGEGGKSLYEVLQENKGDISHVSPSLSWPVTHLTTLVSLPRQLF